MQDKCKLNWIMFSVEFWAGCGFLEYQVTSFFSSFTEQDVGSADEQSPVCFCKLFIVDIVLFSWVTVMFRCDLGL